MLDELQEFIAELAQHEVDLTSSLRKAKILTSGYHSPELDEWINSELDGYPESAIVPDYRSSPADNYGEFAGPASAGGAASTTLRISTDDLPQDVKEFAEKLVMLDGVRALQSHEAEDNKKPWPLNFVIAAQEATAIQGGLFLTSAYQHIPAAVYTDIVEKVRNRLFSFLLDLQNRNSTPEESSESAIGRLVNYHIYGGQNVVATAEQVSQQVKIVQKNDAASLLAYLREHGVAEDDLRELSDAIAAEPEASGDNFGPKVGAWVGGMLGKASTGVWQAGIEVAANVLTNALKGYYGMCPWRGTPQRRQRR